ncbi:MAG: hypothetical protein J6S85_06675 [Methanobrevibacter sp.]|nr:hypothetical protein [Methanobrevibacter sp.]
MQIKAIGSWEDMQRLEHASKEEIIWCTTLTVDAVHRYWKNVIQNLHIVKNYIDAKKSLDILFVDFSYKILGFEKVRYVEGIRELLPRVIEKMEKTLEIVNLDWVWSLNSHLSLTYAVGPCPYKETYPLRDLFDDLPGIIDKFRYSFVTPITYDSEKSKYRVNSYDYYELATCLAFLEKKLDEIFQEYSDKLSLLKETNDETKH